MYPQNWLEILLYGIIRINPTGEDTYETVLEIDKDMMIMMLKSARRT